jgi:CheY-like chemotaxis protein/two-component sensor histidine kinase
MKYLRQVHQTCLRAADLIKKLLAFSRGTESELRPLSFAEIVEHSFEMLGPILPSSIAFSADIEPDLPQIMADSAQLDQVIMNLCINARDAMHGEGAIEVSLRRAVVDHQECISCHHLISGEFVELRVKDNGPGIEQEDMNKLFEPFFTTKEVGKGTGLGLAMVHGVVHTHGGHIRVISEPGRGAEFILYFPVADVSGHTETAAASQLDSAAEPRALGGKHILLVDDQQDVANMMSDLLTYLGYTVSAFIDSQEALAIYKQNPQAFDLLLTDQTMPHLTGVELSKAVMEIRPDFPVVLFTGFSTVVNEESALQMGIRAYVEKPVDTTRLIHTLSEILNAA